MPNRQPCVNVTMADSNGVHLECRARYSAQVDTESSTEHVMRATYRVATRSLCHHLFIFAM